jgi:hypothetical protein
VYLAMATSGIGGNGFDDVQTLRRISLHFFVTIFSSPSTACLQARGRASEVPHHRLVDDIALCARDDLSFGF